MDTELFERQLSPEQAARGYAEAAAEASTLRHTRQRNSRLVRIGAVSVAVLAVGAAGGAITLGHSNSASAGQFNPAVVAPKAQAVTERVSGGTAAEQQLLTSILSGMDSDQFLSASIGSAPAGTGQDGPWLYFTTPAGAQRGADIVKPAWEAMLVAGAYRDRSTDAGLPANIGFSIRSVMPDGSSADLAGGDSILGPQMSTPATAYTADQIVQKISAHFPTHQLVINSISFVRPNQLAPVVVATTSDPQAFINSDYDLKSIFGDVNSYEGVYVQVNDEQGNPVIVLGIAPRIGEVTRWIRPNLDTHGSSGVAPIPTGDAVPIPTS